MDDRQTHHQIPWPSAWLMTDARIGDRLWDVLARLPAGSGVVLRDSSLGPEIARVCHENELILAVSRDVALAKSLGAALVHNPAHATALSFSRSVHDEKQARQARADGAALVFVSPVYPTRSHPEAAALGVEQATRLAGIARVPAIALGGMDEVKFEALRERGYHGWAGIDAWIRI